MGLILRAHCEACGFAVEPLRLGASVAQMSGERRSAFHLYPCSACHSIAQVERFLGEPAGAPPCDRCAAPVDLGRGRELRIATLKGEQLSHHRCPACGAARLAFERRGEFL